MNNSETTLSRTGVLKGHYAIIRALGQGGFSVVYLVRDLQDGGKLYALKEVFDQRSDERRSLDQECQLLMRLYHPSLPKVYKLFEEGGHACLLMEYIAGPNLETLRKQQPEKRFPLDKVLRLLDPIVSALSYLHRQSRPVIHQDIKPANIVVREGSEQAVLVDFGIAKEYHPDSTVSAVRRFTPGYGAPEQHNTVSSTVQTDVYGFGATCYALLSGSVPVDSFYRATLLAIKRNDPLQPLSRLAPDLPEEVGAVIERAMSMNSEERYASIEEFWQALKDAAWRGTTPGSRQQVLGGRRRAVRRTPLALALLLILTAISVVRGSTDLAAGKNSLLTLPRPQQTKTIPFPFQQMDGTPSPVQGQAVLPSSTVGPGATPQSTTTPQVTGYSVLAKEYAGTMQNLATGKRSAIALKNVRQQKGEIQGNFQSDERNDPFEGVVDTSQHVLFTVGEPDSGHALFFEGTVRPDHYLTGNYCQLSAARECVGDYGLWTLEPVA
jgi:serine/threonine protein kinase